MARFRPTAAVSPMTTIPCRSAYSHRALVPDHTDVVADLGIDEEVVVHAVIGQQKCDGCGELLGRRDRRDHRLERLQPRGALLRHVRRHRDAGRNTAGATALTRMPCGPYMNAADFVRPMMPCLETVYAFPDELPRNAASLATFTIEPAPASIMAGSTARSTLNAPVRLIAMTRSQHRVTRLVRGREVVIDAGDVRESVDPTARGGDDRVDVLLHGDVGAHGHDVEFLGVLLADRRDVPGRRRRRSRARPPARCAKRLRARCPRLPRSLTTVLPAKRPA